MKKVIAFASVLAVLAGVVGTSGANALEQKSNSSIRFKLAQAAQCVWQGRSYSNGAHCTTNCGTTGFCNHQTCDNGTWKGVANQCAQQNCPPTC